MIQPNNGQNQVLPFIFFSFKKLLHLDILVTMGKTITISVPCNFKKTCCIKFRRLTFLERGTEIFKTKAVGELYFKYSLQIFLPQVITCQSVYQRTTDQTSSRYFLLLQHDIPCKSQLFRSRHTSQDQTDDDRQEGAIDSISFYCLKNNSIYLLKSHISVMLVYLFERQTTLMQTVHWTICTQKQIGQSRSSKRK